MKDRLLSLIRCLKCGGGFSLNAFLKEGGEVVSGKLDCRRCGTEYPIIRAVPRILPEEMMEELVFDKYPRFMEKYSGKFRRLKGGGKDTFERNAKKRTSRSFGFEWKKFSEYHGNYTRQFLDWLSPFKPSIFKGKLVLDAGCGMGRHMLVASKYSREIVGIDLSEAVDAAYGNLRLEKNFHLVQADIYNLPFGREFDLVYSIGVLHHLPDPERGFLSLLKHVRRGGKIFVWVYGWENNSVMTRVIEPIRKYFTSHLPHRILYYLSYPVTALLELSCAFYRIARAIPLIGEYSKFLPSSAYLLYISKFSFRHKLAIVFDFLSAPLARYYKRGEFRNWFLAANLAPQIYPHNQNSWKALATVD